MNALAISDQVLDFIYTQNVRQTFPQVELLIGCGDLPFYYLEFLLSTFDVPLIYVLGNHDWAPQHTSDGRILTDVQGGINLHGRVVPINGLTCMGLQGSMRYHPNASLMYTEQEMWQEILRMFPYLLWLKARQPRPIDLLITHAPPFGIHDDKDKAHVGFKVFLTLMHYFKPHYLLHGHVHQYGVNIPHRTQYKQTTVINVFPYRNLQLSFA